MTIYTKGHKYKYKTNSINVVLDGMAEEKQWVYIKQDAQLCDKRLHVSKVLRQILQNLTSKKSIFIKEKFV